MCMPSGADFQILSQTQDEHGGGCLLFELTDPGNQSRRLRAEAVIIPRKLQPWDEARGVSSHGAAVCVSSQAGCPLDCSFCDSGLIKPALNLPAWALVEQVRAAHRVNPSVQRVVFMGIGEPLLNYSQVSSALRELQKCEHLSRPWAITLSTIGVVPRIARLAEDHPNVALALSLHAPNQELRSKLLPAGAARWPLADVMRAVRAHGEVTGRAPMLAYILIPEINNSQEHAMELADLLTNENMAGTHRPFFNIIPYNPTRAGDAHGFRSPEAQELRKFRTELRGRGIRATIRWTTLEGRSTSAACGQLTAALRNAPQKQVGAQESPTPTDFTNSKHSASEATISVEMLTSRLSRAPTAEDLLQAVEEHVQRFNPIHLSAAMVTLARSCKSGCADFRQDHRFASLIDRIGALLPSFQAQTTANVLSGLGKIRYHQRDDVLWRLTEHATDQLSDFWP